MYMSKTVHYVYTNSLYTNSALSTNGFPEYSHKGGNKFI